MSKELDKKTVLPNSAMPVAVGAVDEDGKAIEPLAPRQYDAAGEIKKFGLQPTELLEYKDPYSGKMKSIMIDRRGTTDEKLALTLLDDKISREQKDSVVSAYLFEKGKEGSSMLMDLWMYKGAHTKESRAFQSTMRFDFELFLQVFQIFMMDSSDMIFKNLPVEIREVEEKGEKKDKVFLTGTPDIGDIAHTLGEIALYFKQTSSLLTKRIRAEVDKRERAKGKGIYIGKDNKPYSIYEDGDIVEVVKKDKESVEQEKNGKQL